MSWTYDYNNFVWAVRICAVVMCIGLLMIFIGLGYDLYKKYNLRGKK